MITNENDEPRLSSSRSTRTNKKLDVGELLRSIQTPCEVVVNKNSAYVLKESGHILKLEMVDETTVKVSEVASLG